MPSGCTLVIGTFSPSCSRVTSFAPLRRVRITVLLPCGWAPRTECGSCVSPAITALAARGSAADAGEGGAVIGSSGVSADEPGDGPQRDPQPSGPVPGFVCGLVDR